MSFKYLDGTDREVNHCIKCKKYAKFLTYELCPPCWNLSKQHTDDRRMAHNKAYAERKTLNLDEIVFDAMGWHITETRFDGEDIVPTDGFFTKSIANCKNHIEPVLTTSCDKFKGEGYSMEIAYCNALINLKKREVSKCK